MSEENILKYSGSAKQKLFFAAKILLTFLVLLFLTMTINSDQLFNSFKNIDYSLFLAAALLGIVNIYFQYCKWKLICINTLEESNSKNIWLSLFYGFAGAVITPFRIGEYAGRSIGFRGNDSVKVTLGTLTDKFFSLIIILLAGSTALLIYLKIFRFIENDLLLTLIIAELSAVILIKILITNLGVLKTAATNKLKNIKFIKELVLKAESFTGLDVNLRFRLLLISVLAFFCYTTQYSLLVAALSNGSSFHMYLLAGILTIFTKTIIPPFTLGELGIREGASVFFITQIGLSAAIGFNASILLFFLNIVIPALIGALLLLKRN